MMVGRKYCYSNVQYNFAQVIIDDITAEIEPSVDEWDRGYNAGLTAAIRIIKEYQKITKLIIELSRRADDGDE